MWHQCIWDLGIPMRLRYVQSYGTQSISINRCAAIFYRMVFINSMCRTWFHNVLQVRHQPAHTQSQSRADTFGICATAPSAPHSLHFSCPFILAMIYGNAFWSFDSIKCKRNLCNAKRKKILFIGSSRGSFSILFGCLRASLCLQILNVSDTFLSTEKGQRAKHKNELQHIRIWPSVRMENK